LHQDPEPRAPVAKAGIDPAYVPIAPTPLATPAPARVIAFYLPQFHPIPENDAWWGKGFTEWTNVIRGRPQFEGHYQPHLPDELGFYDLRVQAVQERQAELAKHYGVHGFCFYFYWFGGKRLLETPLVQWRNNDNISLPYCICWANENWSRRWDGLESEVLISQNHSAEDDVAFISHVAEYMRDPRYIRVGGRPLLIVYRPRLLPSAFETTRRWREWCSSNGIGEIHLAYTQSFDKVTPREIGFDSAIEFPPNNSHPPEIIPPALSPDFAGKVFDYHAFVERSRNYTRPGYEIFRSVSATL
jgi:lipopolysaccharide biosynthesis protein